MIKTNSSAFKTEWLKLKDLVKENGAERSWNKDQVMHVVTADVDIMEKTVSADDAFRVVHNHTPLPADEKHVATLQTTILSGSYVTDNADNDVHDCEVKLRANAQMIDVHTGIIPGMCRLEPLAFSTYVTIKEHVDQGVPILEMRSECKDTTDSGWWNKDEPSKHQTRVYLRKINYVTGESLLNTMTTDIKDYRKDVKLDTITTDIKDSRKDVKLDTMTTDIKDSRKDVK